jgi:hypothetical protein
MSWFSRLLGLEGEQTGRVPVLTGRRAAYLNDPKTEVILVGCVILPIFLKKRKRAESCSKRKKECLKLIC